MTVKLNEELQNAVDSHNGRPIAVEHPITHKMYILVEQSTHEKAMKALEQKKVLASIQAGLDDMKAGRGIPIEEAEAQLREELGFPKK